MKPYYILFLIFLIGCYSNFKLKEGDLLFQDLDSSPICDAIELVTPGYNNGNFSHVGIIINNNGELQVLEAIPPKVSITKIEDFINRSFDKNGQPKVIVGRLKEEFRNSIKSGISFIKTQLNKDYDNSFLINNNAFYCSELIYEGFKNDSIFHLQPMTFLNPETQNTLESWKKYYAELNVQIPEGELGINPGIMSISDKIEIIHIFGIPDGMRK